MGVSFSSCLLPFITLSVSGTNIVVASAVESERVEYARIFTTEFFVVFLFMQVRLDLTGFLFLLKLAPS